MKCSRRAAQSAKLFLQGVLPFYYLLQSCGDFHAEIHPEHVELDHNVSHAAHAKVHRLHDFPWARLSVGTCNCSNEWQSQVEMTILKQNRSTVTNQPPNREIISWGDRGGDGLVRFKCWKTKRKYCCEAVKPNLNALNALKYKNDNNICD